MSIPNLAESVLKIEQLLDTWEYYNLDILIGQGFAVEECYFVHMSTIF
jgi:hypothetical protein